MRLNRYTTTALFWASFSLTANVKKIAPAIFLVTLFSGSILAQTITVAPSDTPAPTSSSTVTPDCTGQPKNDGPYQLALEPGETDNVYTMEFDGQELRWWFPGVDAATQSPSNVYDYNPSNCTWEQPDGIQSIFFSGGLMVISNSPPSGGDYIPAFYGFFLGASVDCDDEIYLIDPSTGLEYDLDSAQVQCLPNLPDTCIEGMTSNRGEVTCSVVANDRNVVLNPVALSAEDPFLTSAALKLFGLGTNPDDDRFFVPSGEGLFYTQSGDDFYVYGDVEDVDDASLVYEVSFKYTDGRTGAEWRALQGDLAFKHDQDCPVTADMEDSWIIYIMNNATVSYMQNENTFLTFSHQPSPGSNGLPFWGFQYGIAANNVNCAFGAGGWLSYSGSLDGDDIDGGFGDLLLDLSSEAKGNQCPDADSDGTLTESEFNDAIQNTIIYTVCDEDCSECQDFAKVFYVWDSEAPVISGVPNDTTVACKEDVPPMPTVTITDNCGLKWDSVSTDTILSPTCAFTLVRRWYAMDSCLTSIDEYQILVNDEDAPELNFSCPNDTVLYATGGDCPAATDTASVSVPSFNPTDNCGLASDTLYYEDSIRDSVGFACYVIDRHWYVSATDSCGNLSMDMCIQTITLEDNEKPHVTLECPDDITVYVDENCAVDVDSSNTGSPAAPIFSDNCTLTFDTLYYSDFIPAADSVGTGCYIIERTWTAMASDACENDSTVTCVQTIEVADTLAPEWDDYIIYEFVSCDEILDPTDPTQVPISATDNCSGVRYEIEAHQLSGGCPGTYMRIWTAIDTCGNVSETTEQYLQLYDSIAPVPVLTCPDDAILFVDDMCEADSDTSITGTPEFEITDNCDTAPWDSLSLSYSDSDPSALCGDTYEFTRTWSLYVRDLCENDTLVTCDQTITLKDNTPPTIITAASDTTVECDGSGNAMDYAMWIANHGGATANDNCTENLTWSDSVYASVPLCPNTRRDSVKFTAMDDCGNKSTTTATFTIEDTTPPTLTNNPIDTLNCEDWVCEVDSFIAWGLVSAMDECSGVELTASCQEFSFGCQAEGAYEITYTATDSCGNSTTDTQLIRLEDLEAPTVTIMCPSDTLLYVNGSCYVDLDTANTGAATYTADDNCLLDSDTLFYADVVTDSTSTGCYTITRTWTAEAIDACNQKTTKTCDQTIMVMDNIKPSIDLTCPNDTTIYVDGACAADLDPTNTGDITVSYDDNCELDTTGDDYADVVTDSTSTGCYTIERTWTATASDMCGNDSTTTCTQTIMVMDNIDPTLTVTGSDSVTVYLDEMCDVDLSIDAVGGVTWDADDNCTLDTVIVSNPVDGEITKICPCTSDTLECPEPDFRTHTMGGWGTNCNGNNPGCYRDANFDAAFPSGVTIGCAGGNTHTFTTSNAVAVYLPCGGTPGVLANSGVDGTCIGNTLSGQLLSAKLSLGFDAYDPDFSGADVGIDQLYSTNPGPCFGMTIVEIVALADSVIGGCKSGNASGLNNLLTDFNETYVGGVISNDGWAIEGCEDGYYIVTDCDTLEQGSYMFERELTVTATDACGNDSSVTHTQVITVLDTLAPQFTETCDLTNGGSASVCCEDWNGDVDWESSVTCDEISAVDNCDTEVYITYTDDFDGDFAPNPYVTSYCHAYQPEEFEDDETCTGHDPHALRMFNVPGIGTEMYGSTAFPGVVENNADGTWSLTQEVFSMDGSGGGWIIQVTYGVAMDWDEWTEQDGYHTFKLDCGELDDDHENWDYRILESGTMIGTGTYYGDTLEVYHAPSNELFGFQIGLGASGQNNNYGYGAWLYYSGTINGTNVNGTGDIFGDLDCCLPWSVTRTWTALDDCENGTTFSYTVNVNGANETDCPDTPGGDVNLGGSTADDHGPVVIGGAGDLTTGKTPIRVTNLQPNPTNDWSMLGFTVTENMRLRVDMYSMDGALIAELYDGIAAPNVNHTLDIPAQDLDAGMYQIRLSSSDYLVVKKLLVSQ